MQKLVYFDIRPTTQKQFFEGMTGDFSALLPSESLWEKYDRTYGTDVRPSNIPRRHLDGLPQGWTFTPEGMFVATSIPVMGVVNFSVRGINEAAVALGGALENSTVYSPKTTLKQNEPFAVKFIPALIDDTRAPDMSAIHNTVHTLLGHLKNPTTMTGENAVEQLQRLLTMNVGNWILVALLGDAETMIV